MHKVEVRNDKINETVKYATRHGNTDQILLELCEFVEICKEK